MTLLAEAVLPIITGGGTCRIKKPLGRWLKSKQYTGSLEPLPTQGIFHPSNFMMYCKELFILRHGKLWSCLGSRAVSALHLTKGWSDPTVQVFLTLRWTLKRRGSMTEVFVQVFLLRCCETDVLKKHIQNDVLAETCLRLWNDSFAETKHTLAEIYRNKNTSAASGPMGCLWMPR